MRRYSIRINDTIHTLDVEETSHDHYVVTLEDGSLVDVVMEDDQDLAQATITPAIAANLPAQAAPATRRSPATRPVPPRQAAVSAVPTGGSGSAAASVIAPMPGVVLSIEVAPGDSVSRGQTLLILEAMKMKNEIKAQRDATIATIHVQPGSQVKHGDPLLDYES